MRVDSTCIGNYYLLHKQNILHILKMNKGSQAIALFETQLLHKVQFKASSKVSADAFLFKAFKFFDLYNHGWLTRIDFFKAVAKCGVVVDTHDMDEVFTYYGGQTNQLDYKLFIQNLLFKDQSKMSQSSLSLSNPEKKQNKELRQSKVDQLKQSKVQQIYQKIQTYEQVMEVIKSNLRMNNGLLDLANRLKKIDTDHSHIIHINKLQGFFPYLAQDNLNTVVHALNPSQRDEINFAQLIYHIKGQCDSSAEKTIGEVFKMLDAERKNEISIQSLISSNAQASQSFKDAIELYCSFQGITDGIFTDQDFVDFFGFVCFAAPDTFHQYMQKAYCEDGRSKPSRQSSRHFRESRKEVAESRKDIGQERKEVTESRKDMGQERKDFKKNKDNQDDHRREQIRSQHERAYSNVSQKQYSEKSQNKSRYSEMQKKQNIIKEIQQILLRVKKRLSSKGTKGFLLFEKAMRNADTNRDSLLNFQQFRQVVKEQRIDITPLQSDAIFQVFDEQHTGYLNYSQFVYTLRGDIPPQRKTLVDKLISTLYSQQEVLFATLKHLIAFKNHPDIQNGRRCEEDIWKQIQETIMIIKDLNNTVRSNKITKIQLEEYMDNLSLSIADDKLFEYVLSNFWRVDISNNITEKYAGSRKMFDHTKNGYLVDHHRYVVQGGSVSQSAPFGTTQEPTCYFTQNRKL